MICPTCGAQVHDGLKFCENCGTRLEAAQAPAMPAEQPIEPAGQPVAPLEQPTASAVAYTSEAPADSAWEAQPQQAHQTDPTMQMPAQPGQAGGGYVPPAGAPQPPYQQVAAQQATSGNRAPNAAFVLTIVGLVLSCLFVTFLPGLVCSIIGLVLNAGYNKKGFDNPRKTSTMILGIIGLVIGVLSLVLFIFIGVVTARVVDEIDKQGIDIATESVSVTTDSSGNINISVKDSSGAASSAAASSASASSSAASSAGSTTSQTGSSKYTDSKFHDTEWNPTLYALLELSGTEMQDLLSDYNFSWDKASNTWTASDGSQFGAYGSNGLIGKDDIAALPQGAAGQANAYGLTVEGYSTPTAAFNALTGDLVTEDMYGDDKAFFAVVYGPSMVRHLVAVTETDTNEQTFLVFTEESIAQGVFESIVGTNIGATMDEAWQAITGGYHIGGYVSK